ncbi:ABC transporter ATP-binding protein [Halolamina sp. C58]|uniref:ABC transporter ATP-binding protein n=1 Tax=Halolamina sp. C58 TaxID=3421640 RepID=UPI003EBF5AA1
MPAESNPPVIAVDDLTRTYGDTTAVEDVSFEVHANEIFALVGPNGAGKTTTVEILECLRTPTSGSANVLGYDVGEESRKIKQRIGVVPQSFHTFDRLTVRENVTLARQLYEEGNDPETILDQLDLTDYAGTRFAALSGGYQRRTGIAMALVSDPDVLFLDEPTTGLDPAARRSTWEQIDRLTDLGTTVVLTTHYMEEVEELADRAALLVDGEIVAVDTVADLVDTYGGDVKLVVNSSENRSEELEAELRSVAADVYQNDTGALVGVFEARADAQEAFGQLLDVEGEHSIELTEAGMEDVFLRLAGGTVGSGGELQ